MTIRNQAVYDTESDGGRNVGVRCVVVVGIPVVVHIAPVRRIARTRGKEPPVSTASNAEDNP